MIVAISITEDALKLDVIQGNMLALKSPYYVHAEINGRSIWVLLAGKNLKHFKTDLMSGPEKLKKELELTREDYKLASITHDWLYAFATVTDSQEREMRITRNECDLLMMDILESLQCPQWKRDKMYSFLHKWAWIAWCKHRILGFFNKKGHTW